MTLYTITKNGVMKQLPDIQEFAWNLQYWLKRVLLIVLGMMAVCVIYQIARVWI